MKTYSKHFCEFKNEAECEEELNEELIDFNEALDEKFE